MAPSQIRRPGIYVATPAYGASCYMPYVTAMLSLQNACAQAGIGFNHFYVTGTALLHEQRNVAVAAFRHRSDLSHLLFVDADLGFDGRDIVRMVYEKRDVVVGPYPAKHMNWEAIVRVARMNPAWSPEQVAIHAADYATNIYGLDGQEHLAGDTLNEISCGGAGLMLLTHAALERFAKAYPDASGRFPDAYRRLVPDVDTIVEYFSFGREPDGRILSEDITFCKKWREIGGRIFAAPWVRTVHVGPYYFQGDLPALLGKP